MPTLDLTVRYFHFLAIFVMFALLTCEHLLLKNRVEQRWIRSLSIIDAAYGISALVALLCGIGLWWWVGKPAGFYSGNWAFHLKITLFGIAAVLSLLPTLFILKARKRRIDVEVPAYVVWCIRAELLLLCCIPALAVMMANGYGYVR